MSNSDYTTLYCIYRIVNFKTGQVYVGQTNDFKKRSYEHLAPLEKGNHYNPHLQNAYNKYGREAFYIEIIESGIPKDEVGNREVYWINHYDSFYNGYNRTIGGEGNGGWNKIICTWNGVKYSSISEAARANNTTTSNMLQRLSRGWTCDMDVPSRSNHLKIPCTWNGIEYSSISEAARANTITSASMCQRLARGWTCDDDIPRKRTR